MCFFLVWALLGRFSLFLCPALCVSFVELLGLQLIPESLVVVAVVSLVKRGLMGKGMAVKVAKPSYLLTSPVRRWYGWRAVANRSSQKLSSTLHYSTAALRFHVHWPAAGASVKGRSLGGKFPAQNRGRSRLSSSLIFCVADY